MFVLIKAENGLSYCLLSEIDSLSLLKTSTHLKRVFSDIKYLFTKLKTSSNVLFLATSRLCRVKIYSRIVKMMY